MCRKMVRVSRNLGPDHWTNPVESYFTWKTVLSLVSMFLNCSSSSSVSAEIIGSILPVFKFGTWNTSFIRSFESIRPDQENR